MPENSFDKELIASNLLGATNLQELHKKEKVLSNTKMLMFKEYFFKLVILLQAGICYLWLVESASGSII